MIFSFPTVLVAFTSLVIPALSIPTPANAVKNNCGGKPFWKPAAGTTWQIELSKKPTDLTLAVDVFDIDLFDNSRETISQLHANGKKVICYFSAGSYEKWRPDAAKFAKEDLGSPLVGWPGEFWLNTTSPSVRAIMTARIDLAVTKGCDAIDPDNMDGYDNANGLHLSQDTAVNYARFLATTAHARGLAIGLKNAGAIIPRVLDQMQFAVNEQCVAFNECVTTRPFIDAGKPVFGIEYPSDAPNLGKGEAATICGDQSRKGFSTLLKEMGLGEWRVACPL